ncbi:MAG: hypothetical protein IAF58_16635 [Leptolyngbya sp.]|nr:hypothetical protein [Candidatus Melainabacteria bacterium]
MARRFHRLHIAHELLLIFRVKDVEIMQKFVVAANVAVCAFQHATTLRLLRKVHGKPVLMRLKTAMNS